MADGSWLTRRNFLKMGLATTAGLTLYSGEIARHELEVLNVTIKLQNLPEAFHGFRIVQISDLHFHEFTEEFFLRRVLRRVNELRPDAVLMTGDYISTSHTNHVYPIEQAYICGDILRMVECPLKYGVLGNHDSNAGEEQVTRAMSSQGLPILLNENVPIERGNSRIWIAGLRDMADGRTDPEAAIPQKIRSAKEPVILMMHQPDYADRLLRTPASQYVSLMLSGHSHGGQVRMPFVPPIKSLLPPEGRKYVEGLFQLNNLQLYVNRGIGTTGVPFRLNCPPEITLLKLERA